MLIVCWLNTEWIACRAFSIYSTQLVWIYWVRTDSRRGCDVYMTDTYLQWLRTIQPLKTFERTHISCPYMLIWWYRVSNFIGPTVTHFLDERETSGCEIKKSLNIGGSVWLKVALHLTYHYYLATVVLPHPRISRHTLNEWKAMQHFKNRWLLRLATP